MSVPAESSTAWQSLKEIFLVWFFGLLWGFGLSCTVTVLLLQILYAFMGGGTTGGVFWNLPLLCLAISCIMISPVILLMLQTRSWIRGLVGGVIANVFCIIFFIFILLIGSQILEPLNNILGTQAGDLIYLLLTIPPAFVILVVFFADLKSWNTGYLRPLFGVALGLIISGVSGYFLEQLLWDKHQADIPLYTWLVMVPLVWLYSISFVKIFSGNPTGITIFSIVLFTLLLTGITFGLPFIGINLFGITLSVVPR